MAVDEYLVELNTLTFQRLENEIMHRPERFFGKGLCAQPVLVAHHHEAEVCFLYDKTQVFEHVFHKYELLKSVNLLVGRLFDECAIAVYKEYLLGFHAVIMGNKGLCLYFFLQPWLEVVIYNLSFQSLHAAYDYRYVISTFALDHFTQLSYKGMRLHL